MTAELPADASVLVAAALLAAGVLGAGFADRLRVPGLLLFLGLGMLIGDDGLALVSFDDPEFAQAVGTVALLIILYEGGLTTKPRDVRQAALPGLLLATVGVAVTAVVVAGAAWLVLDLSLVTAFLVGAVVSSTDAAAVFTVLRRTPLPRSMRSLLEVESGANDPMAIMLTMATVAIPRRGKPSKARREVEHTRPFRRDPAFVAGAALDQAALRRLRPPSLAPRPQAGGHHRHRRAAVDGRLLPQARLRLDAPAYAATTALRPGAATVHCTAAVRRCQAPTAAGLAEADLTRVLSRTVL